MENLYRENNMGFFNNFQKINNSKMNESGRKNNSYGFFNNFQKIGSENSMAGGAIGNWIENRVEDHFISYSNNNYPNIHCTVHNSGDIHCKRSGSKYCGFFNRIFKSNHNLSRDAFSDFMHNYS